MIFNSTKDIMKYLLKYVLLVLFVGTIKAHYLYPKLTFKYDWRGKCIDFIGNIYCNSVKTKDIVELQEKMPVLIAAWELSAPKLFSEIYTCFQRGFKDKERSVIVYLSDNWSYGSSNFLVISMRNLLDVVSWDSFVSPISREENLLDTIFHELLHVWVDENIHKSKSPLLKKYHNEHVEVRDHIHLMALQKMVYTKLCYEIPLSFIDIAYRMYCPPTYKRAWEIVNDIEGYEEVLHDITVSLKKTVT